MAGDTVDPKLVFGPWDYTVFAATLLISAGIGFVFGCTGGKQKTASEFLMGNRKMSLLPTSMSLLASFTSAVLVMGTPAEIYAHGTLFNWRILGMLLALAVSAHLYVPFFYRLQVTSVFEYLERRFSRPVRLMAVAIYTLQMSLYLGIVLYVPSLALSTVTGLSVEVCVVTVGAVCTLYTAVGGMKAVMWTDTFQVFIMVSGMLAIVIRGCLMLGIENIWRDNVKSGRIDFFNWSKALNPDPRERHTIWGLVIGTGMTWISTYGVNQAQIQRALSVPSLRTAQIAYWVNFPGLLVMVLLPWLTGLILYSHYKDCDPVISLNLRASDQMVILYVMEVLGQLPGMSGLVISAAFSGSLSTLSTGYNSLAAVILTDIITLRFKMAEQRAAVVSKCLAAGFGALSIGLAFFVSLLGSFFLQISTAAIGIVGGPVLALFTMGIFFPWVNSRGAAAGLVLSLACTTWIGVGSIIYKPYVHKYPVSTAGCNLTFTAMYNITTAFNVSEFGAGLTVSEPFNRSMDKLLLSSTEHGLPSTPSLEDRISESRSGLRGLYSLSYTWMAPLALLICTVVSHVVSAATGFTSPADIDPILISPLYTSHGCCLPKRWRTKSKHNLDLKPSEKEGISTYKLSETEDSSALELQIYKVL